MKFGRFYVLILFSFLAICDNAYAQQLIGHVNSNISTQILLDGQPSTFSVDANGALWVDNYTGHSSTTPIYSKPAQFVPVAPSQMALSVSSTSATTLTVPAGVLYANITVEGEGIRWRDDGTNPTATVGQPVPVGAMLTYYANPSNLRIIAQQGTATIDVSYYK
ncbi:MAG: hypothetical protein KGI54_14485 [Pseudomonadota bacterium]|nr:hypothetical protein [Pseudomonadota bacterium]